MCVLNQGFTAGGGPGPAGARGTPTRRRDAGVGLFKLPQLSCGSATIESDMATTVRVTTTASLSGSGGAINFKFKLRAADLLNLSLE